MPTVAELLASAHALERLDAELLLAAALGRKRAWLIAHREAPVPAPAVQVFSSWAERRAGGEPLAYIVGTKEFWSLPIRVTPDTLIPRPESEGVVEAALENLPRDFDGELLDLATGSGCIALAIASERPRASVTGSDISAAAIEVAADNAHDLGIRNVEFVVGSWYEPLAGRRFDLITANPPYVEADSPCLATPELSHEPSAALSAGGETLAAYRAIFAGAAEHLHPAGVLIIEHGSEQQQRLRQMLAAAGLECLTARRDLAGHPRVLVARRR